MSKYGDMSLREAGYAARKFLENQEPTIVLGKVFDSKPLPANETKVAIFHRSIPKAAVTTPLTEGISPAASGFNFEKVQVTIDQWGDYVPITDQLVDFHTDDVIGELQKELGKSSGATLEKVRWGVAKSGTQVIYANGASRSAVNTPITRTKLRGAIRLLERNKAAKITEVLNSTVDYGTRSVEPAYVCFAHTDAEQDIRDMTGFINVVDYGPRKRICDEEIGSVEKVRFVLSADLDPFLDAGGAPSTTVVSNGGSAADVYPFIVVGAHALGDVAFKGKNAVTPTMLKPNTPRGGDDLGQRGSMGWKAYYTALVLNHLWLVRIEAAVTRL